MEHEQAEKPVLCSGQFQKLIPQVYFARDPVKEHRTGTDLPLRFRLVHGASPKQGADARAEFSQLERLCDIVIPAAVQPADNAGLLIRSGKKYDRRRIPGRTHFLTDHEPRAIRKGHIQKKHVIRMVRPQGMLRFPDAPRHIQFKSVLLKRILQAVDQPLVILQQQ